MPLFGASIMALRMSIHCGEGGGKSVGTHEKSDRRVTFARMMLPAEQSG